MASDKKISQLTTWTPAWDSWIPFVDLVAWETKKTTKDELKWDTWNGIDNIALTWTVWLVDTYTITYTDATTHDYEVTNWEDWTDWNGIDNIALIDTTWLVKTYRITYTDATTFDYTVTDWEDWADGTDWNTVLNWTINPTSEWVNWDFYLNTVSVELFWPKSWWAWAWSWVVLEGTDWVDADELQLEYSINGSTSWHTPFELWDLYIRSSTDWGSTWSDWIKFVWVDGEDWVVQAVVWWTNITVDATDPANPIVNFTWTVGVDWQQIYYVGKNGNDSNDWLTTDKAFLTFWAAITEATAQTPTSTNRFVVYCDDAWVYTEDVVSVEWVDVKATSAVIDWSLTVADNQSVRICTVDKIIKSSWIALSYIDACRIKTPDTETGVLNSSAWEVIIKARRVDAPLNWIGVNNTWAWHIHCDINGLALEWNNAIWIQSDWWDIVGSVEVITEDWTPTTTTALKVVDWHIDMGSSEILADTAYNVATGKVLTLQVWHLEWTKTVADWWDAQISEASKSTDELAATWIVNWCGSTTLNADISKLDITAGSYYIQGTKYVYAWWTAVVPTIWAWDSSTWVWFNASWLVYSTTKWSSVQTETILPISRLQSVQWDSWPWSDLTPPIDERYIISEPWYLERLWHTEAIWVLYNSGGTYSESGTDLQIDQSSWVFYDAQRKRQEITADTDIPAIAVYHVSWSWSAQTKATLVTPKYYDNQTDIVSLPVNKWASHTILRSPKEDDSFFLIYSQAAYDSQAEAEAAWVDYWLFVNQSTSWLVAVASIIIKGSSSNIDEIADRRPFAWWNNPWVVWTATMQQTYDNSTSPEILTDATRWALSIKRWSAADTDCVFEWLNWAWSQTFCVDGNGKVDATELVLDTALAIAEWGTWSTTKNFVDLTTAQTVAWVKTFSSSPIVPAPTTDLQVATKKYVDDNAGWAVASTQTEVTAWENVTAWEAVVYVEAVEAWDINIATYDSKFIDISWEDLTPIWIAFKSDWSKCYLVWDTNNLVFQYTLSTVWDISTATYDTVSIAAWDWTPIDIKFSPDWTKMFVIWVWQKKVIKHNLSTAWDLSTAVNDTVWFSLSSQLTTPSWIVFKSDWTKMYVCWYGNDTIYQYTMSTWWDLTTATYDTKSFSVSWQDAVPYSLEMNDNWTKIFVLWRTNDTVFEYDMSTAYDISTASYNSISFSVSSQDTVPWWIAFKSDWSKLYVSWASSDNIYQYSTWTAVSAWYYLSDASDSSLIDFKWFADTTVTSWNPVNLNQAGVDGNQSGLTVWDYYLADSYPWSPIVDWTAITQNLQTHTTSWWTEEAFAYSTTQQEAWQSFLVWSDTFLRNATVYLAKYNSPTGDITCDLYDSDENLLTTSSTTLDWSTLTTTHTSKTFAFDDYELTDWNTYILVLKSDGANSTTHHFTWATYTPSVYADGTSYWINSTSTFTARTTIDRRFSLNMWVWTPIKWAISQTPWTNSVKVWEYMSATEILIESGGEEASWGWGISWVFSAYSSWTQSLTTSAVIMSFETELIDDDWNYDTWTYKYTAPSDWNYMFNVFLWVNGLNTWDRAQIDLVVNTTVVARFEETSSSSSATLHMASILLALTASDTVHVTIANIFASRWTTNWWITLNKFSWYKL